MALYTKDEISLKLEKQLNICKWESINNKEYFTIELPVVLYFNYQRLVLYIHPMDDGYYITDDGNTFVEFSNDTKHYIDLFNDKDNNYHYDISLKDNYIFKSFKYDYSLMSAIDEFIRYFIYLDNFMKDNDIV